MLIDWFTVGAQLVNFVVLFWLMKRFLYQPILDAIDAREARITAELSEAAAKLAEANAKRGEFQRKNDEIDQQRSMLLAQASSDAAAERQRLFDEARKAAEEFSSRRMQTLKNDADRLNQALRRRTAREVFAITRKVLTDLAASDLEERLTNVFIERIRGTDGETKEAFSKEIGNATEPFVVRSAFDLPAERQAIVEATIREVFEAKVPIRFETDFDLITGVELRNEGQKLAWSVSDYLSSLEANVTELLERQTKIETAPAVKAGA